MKYFAILKDSLRESLDSKVLYVMFGLSTIVIVLVGSLSFKPLAAEKSLESLFFWSEQNHPFEKGKKIEQPPMLNLIMAVKKTTAQFGLAMHKQHEGLSVDQSRSSKRAMKIPRGVRLGCLADDTEERQLLTSQFRWRRGGKGGE